MKSYKEYAELLSKKFNSRLEDILPDYYFDYGVEFEIAICEIFRAFLPEKYGVCRGHIVNYDGNNVGDDIIIYDQQSFPTIRLHKKQQFARKENIPLEAVYAYFEAKHNLTEVAFNKALGQIRNVKEFVSKRKRIKVETFDPYLDPLDRETDYSKNYPEYRNPVYCGIISRKTDLSDERIEELEKEFEDSKKDKNNPETIIFSKATYMQIGYDEDDGFQPTNFLLENKSFSYSVIKTIGDLAFGLGLINLISAIDWTRLGRVDWIKVLNHYIQNKSENNN